MLVTTISGRKKRAFSIEELLGCGASVLLKRFSRFGQYGCQCIARIMVLYGVKRVEQRTVE
jgi:hypothetical protein